MRGEVLTIEDAVSRANGPEIDAAIRFGERLYKANIVSKGIGSALGYRFAKEDEGSFRAFSAALLAGDANDTVGVAGAWLRSRNVLRVPLEAERRIRTIHKAWRDHLTRRDTPAAVNDDAPIAKAA